MSFTCAVTNKIVNGKSQALVPVLKRKVRYQKFVNKKDRNGDFFKVFVGEPSEGWETVKEVSTTSDHEVELTNDYENNFESEVKTVYVRVSNKELIKQKEKENRNSNENYLGNYMKV